MSPLTRTGAGTLLVALLLLAAGCNAGGPTTTASPSTTAPTTQPTTATTDGSGEMFPEGFSRDGIDGDPPQLLRQQYRTLNGTSYTVNYRVNVQGEIEQGRYEVNHAERRGLARQASSGSPVIEAYTADGGETTFQRTLEPGNATYQRGTVPFALFHSRSRAATVVLPSYRDLNWTYDGTVTENGTERLVYTVSEVDTSGRASFDPSRVSDLTGRLEVTPDGRILLLAWSATVDDRSEVVYEYRLSAVGETTVEEPGWLSEAREQATAADDGSG